MNKVCITISVLALFFASQVFAASSHDAHTSKKAAHTMDHAAKSHTGHEDHVSGMKIHESHQDGYVFEYRLIDMKEKMKEMKNMPEMKDTHHLMVFVKDAKGGPVKTAKVGYLIQDAAGEVQKKMTMAMNDGFGADVTFESGKHYQVKTKVMAGTKTLMDEFEYMGGSH